MCARLCEWRQEMRCVSRLGKSVTNKKRGRDTERGGGEDQRMHYAIPESGQTKQKLNQRKPQLQ